MAEAQHRPGSITDPKALNKETVRHSRGKGESGNPESGNAFLFCLARGMRPVFHWVLGPWNASSIPPSLACGINPSFQQAPYFTGQPVRFSAFDLVISAFDLSPCLSAPPPRSRTKAQYH
jgi:hypothetical protein